VASPGAAPTHWLAEAVTAAAGTGTTDTFRRAAADGASGCRESPVAERAAAFVDANGLDIFRTARAVRDGALDGRLDFAAVAPAAAEGLAEEAVAAVEVSSAWAVPAPASATPTPSVTAPTPNHP